MDISATVGLVMQEINATLILMNVYQGPVYIIQPVRIGLTVIAAFARQATQD